jgi:hypothetical protein
MRWYPAFFRRPGCLLALGLLVAIVIALCKLGEPVQLDCTHLIVDRLPSPDGAWVAVIDESTCDVGMGGSGITADLHLVRTKSPVRDINLLGVDTHGDASNRPRIAWSAPNGLQVTVPLSDYLRLRNTWVEGLQVEVRFDPDDPLVEQICRGQIGRPPDPADNTTKK